MSTIIGRPSWETAREITHEEASEISSRLIASHFRRTDIEQARASIPARPDYDDDLLITAYIAQQARKDAAGRPSTDKAVTFFLRMFRQYTLREDNGVSCAPALMSCVSRESWFDRESRRLLDLLTPAKPPQVDEHWPNGCIRPGSCSRHRQCVYAMSADKCRHYGKDLTADIAAATRVIEHNSEGRQ